MRVGVREAEVHWRSFLEGLQDRGIRGIKLITSDNHASLKAAREAVLAGVPWQRCQFHTIQNAMAHVPKMATARISPLGSKTIVPEALTVLRIPAIHRRRLRTTNGLKGINKEIKLRTRVATLFPNEASLLRLERNTSPPSAIRSKGLTPDQAIPTSDGLFFLF